MSDTLASYLLQVIARAQEEVARMQALAAQPGREYTAGEIRDRKATLYRQLVWLTRREEAACAGQPFTEPPPEKS